MATAAIYHLKEKNRLTTDPDNIDFSIQRGEVTVKGVEFEVMANLDELAGDRELHLHGCAPDESERAG